MSIKQVFSVSRKTFINPRGWLGYDALKAHSQTLWKLIKVLFSRATPEYTETFDEAMHRLGLNESDIENTKNSYLSFAIFFLILAVATLFLGLYLIIKYVSIAGLVLALASTALFLSQAFKYHFWYFQIKHRKLGCTYEEWRSGTIHKDSAE